MKNKIIGVVAAMGCFVSTAAWADGASNDPKPFDREKAYQQHQQDLIKRYEARTEARAAATAQQEHINQIGAFIKSNPNVHKAYLASKEKGLTLDQAQKAHDGFVGAFISAARAQITTPAKTQTDVARNLQLRRMAYSVTDLPSPFSKGFGTASSPAHGATPSLRSPGPSTNRTSSSAQTTSGSRSAMPSPRR